MKRFYTALLTAFIMAMCTVSPTAHAQSAANINIRAYNRFQKPITNSTLYISKTDIKDVIKGSTPTINFANSTKCGMIKQNGASQTAVQQLNTHNQTMAVKLAEIVSQRPHVTKCITNAEGNCLLKNLPRGIYHITGVSHSNEDIYVWNYPIMNTGMQNQDIILRPDDAAINAPHCAL